MSIKKAVVVLAGGLGSRYKGLKQIDGILENGATLMEYSVYDALQAGFSKIVFIINQHIPQDYVEKINSIFRDRPIEIHWVLQSLDLYLSDKTKSIERTKPWGTAHAVLCAQEVVQEPFVVINADDFYGRATYLKAAHWIDQMNISENRQCLLAFPVKNTLSENGPVSRGVCSIGQNGILLKIEEKTHIQRKNKEIVFTENLQDFVIHENTLVSMNFWILHPSIFKKIEKLFEQFLQVFQGQQEFYIPTAIQNLIEANELTIEVKASPAEWMGVTFPEDKSLLQEFLKNKIESQQYPEQLWKQ